MRAHRPRRSVRRLCERSFPASSRRRLAICWRLEPRSSREPLAFDASELGVDEYELWADRFHNGELSNRQRRFYCEDGIKARVHELVSISVRLRGSAPSGREQLRSLAEVAEWTSKG